MATERRSEAIWIEAKGYWQVKVQKDGVRKAFTSSIKGRKGKHAAEAKADYWLENGTKEMRFDAAWDIFLQWQKDHNGTGNFVKLETVGRLYLLPELKTRRLSDIKPTHWQRCIDAGLARGLARRSLVNIRSTISAFLRHARRERWEHIRLEDDDLRIPNSAQPAKPKRVLHDSEIQILFSDPYMKVHNRPSVAHYIYAWRFFVVTGMRRGELCGLQWADISGDVLTIRRSINAEGEITHGKNDNARRSFALTNAMKQVLADQRQHLANLGLDSIWVFPDKFGECASPKAVYFSWRAYCNQHNMQISIHELRHTFISINKSDMPIELLKSVVGHSASMDTIGIYGHEVDGDKLRAASIMDATFNRIFDNVGGE